VGGERLADDVRLELKETNPPTYSCRFSAKPMRRKFQKPQNVLIKIRYETKHWE
jgi:hypothetical protein